MKIQFQLTKFLVSTFYRKQTQPMMQVVLIIAFFYLFMQLTMINAFVFFLGSTQDLLLYNLMISNILVFALICYLSISTVFNYYEFNALGSLPLSYEKIASAKLISSLCVPLGITMLLQLPTLLFLILDGKYFIATKLLLFLPIINVFTALMMLFVLSLINRYRYRFKNKLTYLISNTFTVLLMIAVVIAYYISKSTLNITELFSQIDLSSLTKCKETLVLLLNYSQETFQGMPMIHLIILTFMSEKITISFLLLVVFFLVINTLLYRLIKGNISKNYLKNGSSENNQANIKKSKAYIAKSHWRNYLQRELWVIKSEAYFKMQVVLTILLPPVISLIFLVAIQNGVIPDNLNITKKGIFDKYFSYLVLFLCCINNISGTPYSREGKYHFLIKSLPFDHYILYLTKVGFAFFLNMIAVLISFLIYALFGYWNMESTVILLVITCLVICYNLLTPLFDMKNPSSDWTTPSEAIKSNPNVLVSLLFGMPIPVIITAIHFTLLWSGVSPLGSSCIVLSITLVTTMVLYILITNSIRNGPFVRS